MSIPCSHAQASGVRSGEIRVPKQFLPTIPMMESVLRHGCEAEQRSFAIVFEVEDIVKGKMSRVVRLAGFSEAMREHVPVLLSKLRERFPGLKVTLQEIDQRGAEQLIAQGGRTSQSWSSRRSYRLGFAL